MVGMTKRFYHLWVEVTVLPWLGRLLQIGWSRGPCLLGFLPRSGGIRSYRRKNQRFSDVAVTFVVDLAKAFEREQLSAVWHWAGHFVFPQGMLCVLSGCAVHTRSVLFENGSKWSVLLLRVVMHDAMAEVFRSNSELRSRENVDDIRTAQDWNN